MSSREWQYRTAVEVAEELVEGTRLLVSAHPDPAAAWAAAADTFTAELLRRTSTGKDTATSMYRYSGYLVAALLVQLVDLAEVNASLVAALEHADAS